MRYYSFTVKHEEKISVSISIRSPADVLLKNIIADINKKIKQIKFDVKKKLMSSEFLIDGCEYITQATEAAPSTLPDMAGELRRAQLRRLPVNVLYEPLACPVQDFVDQDDLFSVPDENCFYIDLLGPEGFQDVLCAQELRDRTWKLVDQKNVRLWMVNDAYSNACRSILCTERCPGGEAYVLRALFVADVNLVEPTDPEALLLAMTGLADRRRAELRVTPTQTALVRLWYATMGFLRLGKELVRPPLGEMVVGAETLSVVQHQVATHWAAHRAANLNPVADNIVITPPKGAVDQADTTTNEH